MKEIKVGVIGCGYWGPNLIRNFNENYDTEVLAACDTIKKRVNDVKLKYPHIRITSDYRELLKNSKIHAIAIATPVFTHYKLVKEALEAGKHVLVEKPLSVNSKDAEKLINISNKKSLVLMVDHTFIYTTAVQKIKELISSNELGKIYYFDSVRVNLGLFQQDINVIWDLAPHDISIMDFIIKEKPFSVVATVSSHTENKLENMAYVAIKFSNDMLAHFHVNWLSPVKIRRIIIGGSKKMLVYNDLDSVEKLKIFDKGVTINKSDKKSVYHNLVQYRIGDVFAPRIDNIEALKVEVEHFADCIKNRKRPITDGEAGLRVVKILEAIDKSVKKGGVKIKI